MPKQEVLHDNPNIHVHVGLDIQHVYKCMHEIFHMFSAEKIRNLIHGSRVWKYSACPTASYLKKVTCL